MMLLCMLGCKYLLKLVFISFGWIPRHGIAGLCDSSIFKFLRTLHSIFHSAYQFTSPPTVQKSSLLFTPWHICHFFLFDDSILINISWCLIVALICIFLVTSDVKYLFMCLLAIRMNSLETYLFRSFAYFFKLGYMDFAI